MPTIIDIDEPKAIEINALNFYYAGTKAPSLKNIDMAAAKNKVTALIGPSGCGKSTLLRALNRIHDLYPGNRYEGEVLFEGRNILTRDEELITLRMKIGMIFQKPTPFPMSIFDNVAYGLRLQGIKNRSELADRVRSALESAALWDEVKDRLKDDGNALSGGQQQRLCIARAIATEPSVLLMDEPCSALDPIATRQVEDLMHELKDQYTVALVTHNMQQALRVADTTAFFAVDISQGGRTGYLVEMGETKQIFETPREQLTKEYIRGEFS